MSPNWPSRRPKCYNCPKCNKVLDVITFSPKCSKVLNVITFGPKWNKPSMQSFNCSNAVIVDIHIEIFNWQLLHQRIFWPIFMAYYGVADINERLLILMCFWHQIDRRQNNENSDQYLSLNHWLRQFSATDFDDILVWSVLKLTLYGPNYKEKEVHWPIR